MQERKIEKENGLIKKVLLIVLIVSLIIFLIWYFKRPVEQQTSAELISEDAIKQEIQDVLKSYKLIDSEGKVTSILTIDGQDVVTKRDVNDIVEEILREKELGNVTYITNETNVPVLGATGEKGEKGDKGDTGVATLNFKGIYNESTEYKKLDVVIYDGNSYALVVDSVNGIAPSNVNGDSNWALIGVKGEKGQDSSNIEVTNETVAISLEGDYLKVTIIDSENNTVVSNELNLGLSQYVTKSSLTNNYYTKLQIDDSVVKLTGDQTIAGIKTFATSPIVPSKSTAATNDSTAIATEAQLKLVDDKLGSYVLTSNLTTVLGNYVSNNDLATTLGNYITNSNLSTQLNSYVTSSNLTTTLGDYVTNSNLTTTLGDYVTNSNLTTTLGEYVTNNDLLAKLNSYITSNELTTTLDGYVKTTGNQTIEGTKMFETSPIVPSKSTVATNDSTAIATEAQVKLVDDKLEGYYTKEEIEALIKEATEDIANGTMVPDYDSSEILNITINTPVGKTTEWTIPSNGYLTVRSLNGTHGNTSIGGYGIMPSADSRIYETAIPVVKGNVLRTYCKSATTAGVTTSMSIVLVPTK